ncbi:hypothetical protein AVEN_266024-1 [Araneus ventricosus]|uniref:Uncharacterized protein n=1 Tax=Araneus ventricosus TaxID=182803 RepID=A0A4Y2IMT0_ARAVE|nr:hypothetical protein AVEN_266024-1 [Araneus ventricosus]
MERLRKLLAEVETDEDTDFENEPEDVLEEIFQMMKVSANMIRNRTEILEMKKEGYSRGWGDGVNDHAGWESPIHVLSYQTSPTLEELEEKSRLGIKELNGIHINACKCL